MGQHPVHRWLTTGRRNGNPVCAWTGKLWRFDPSRPHRYHRCPWSASQALQGVHLKETNVPTVESKLVDIEAELRGDTDKAYRLYDGKTTEWVPRRLVEDNKDGSWTMPLWLATEKGFI
jgi:hypothetical protein